MTVTSGGAPTLKMSETGSRQLSDCWLCELPFCDGAVLRELGVCQSATPGKSHSRFGLRWFRLPRRWRFRPYLFIRFRALTTLLYIKRMRWVRRQEVVDTNVRLKIFEAG